MMEDAYKIGYNAGTAAGGDSHDGHDVFLSLRPNRYSKTLLAEIGIRAFKALRAENERTH